MRAGSKVNAFKKEIGGNINPSDVYFYNYQSPTPQLPEYNTGHDALSITPHSSPTCYIKIKRHNFYLRI